MNSNLLYFFLVIIFIVGIILITYGLYDWARVQKQEYHKLELENEHFELENKKLKQEFGISDNEKLAKVKRELIKDKKIFENEKNVITSDEYFRIEQLVAQKIIENFSLTHDVVNGFKIGNFEYDVVAASKKFLDKDHIFEIKYLKLNITEEWYTRMIEQMQSLSQNYSAETNHLPYKQVIIVTEKNNFIQVNNFIKRKK